MVPGWGVLHLNWSRQTFYLIAVVGGSISGALLGKRYFIPGMIRRRHAPRRRLYCPVGVAPAPVASALGRARGERVSEWIVR